VQHDWRRLRRAPLNGGNQVPVDKSPRAPLRQGRLCSRWEDELATPAEPLGVW
jgi:hypothetical protein